MIHQFYSKLSEKEKKIFYVAMLIVLLALVDRLFLGPVLTKLHSLDEAVIKQENSIRRDLRFLSYKDRILNESKALSRYYTKEQQMQEEIIASFLKRIEILATQANVNLIRVTPAEEKDKKEYVEYSATLECSGTLSQVVTFMHLINTYEELMRITTMSLSPKKGSGGNEDISASMTVTKIIVNVNGEVAKNVRSK